MKYWLALCLLLILAPARAELSEEQLQAVYPALEQYVEQGRADWNVQAVAVGVVHKDRLVYFRGFGHKSPTDLSAPDVDTLFAIGSTTKAYAAATLAMMVDEGKISWDTRVLDVLPSFRMADPWVTREFRVADLLAQHSGMRPYVLTIYGCLGYSAEQVMDSMAFCEPVTSFRSSFAYVNVPHLVAGRMVAQLGSEPSWEAFLKKRLLDPLGMRRTSWTAQAFNSEPNRAVGYVDLDGRSVPRQAGSFPYVFGPAGGLNSCVKDVSQWVRLQLGDGAFEGKQLISKANLDVTKTPQTSLGQTISYCMGWLLQVQEPHLIIWHNGGTPGHRSFVGLMPAEQLGVIVLTNNGAADLSDAVGLRFFDLAMGKVDGPDYSRLKLEQSQKEDAKSRQEMTRPAGAAPPRPFREYAGTYHSEILGNVQISPTGGWSFPTGAAGVLEPFDGDVFIARCTTEWALDNGASLLGKWTFIRGSQGNFETLRCVLGTDETGLDTRAFRKI